ncbi:Hypothetical predicted protein [Olea europaea subsp. europaea]|uniref:Uncharacterized protein n=1 Tax=Olea europaea subsp. europaea TaxID=158383 RepID=A0A8S0SZV8_OLEEU|nr:Hypothetical predicted protein [Olea europaea subsp. europaea]
MEAYKEGRSFLQRCDKLLNSIAEIIIIDLQLSPVAVHDSSFYGDESSCSPITTKRGINFKGHIQSFEASKEACFDTIGEIFGRDMQLPPWKTVSWTNCRIEKPSLKKIWSEFQPIREHDSTGDLLDIMRGVLKKDLASDTTNVFGKIVRWGYPRQFWTSNDSISRI